MPDNTWICPYCTTDEKIIDFKDKKEYSAHMKNHASKMSGIKVKKVYKKKAKPPIKERQKAPVDPKTQTQPIVLVYKYEGQCTSCGVPIETIDLDMKTTYYVLAWCSNCKKKLRQRKVIKL
jgi:formamidopyrimidine-DNA glycosylase